MATTTQQGPTSIKDLLLEGMDLFDTQFAAVADDAWALPTPCAGWTVEDLVRHVCDTADRASAILRGITWEASGTTAPPVRAWSESSARLTEVLGTISLDGRWPLPDDSPQAKLRFHGCDFAVHRWDLAVALGHEHELPSGWVSYMDQFFHSVPAEVLRRPRAFHDPEAPASDDGPTRRLMAFLGRRPLS
jgi:uncharacterized protein (TIGR03086 family)